MNHDVNSYDMLIRVSQCLSHQKTNVRLRIQVKNCVIKFLNVFLLFTFCAVGKLAEKTYVH